MLRVTKQADYGIVLMTHMAIDPERRCTAPELASETMIPLPMVSKILKILSKSELLLSHRGVKGGYSLARDPGEITVAEMITALEGPIAFTECIEGAPGFCTQEAVCRLRSNWQRINMALTRALEGISLAELAQPMPALVRLGAGRAIEGRVRTETGIGT
jgi:FeS assembly SUF system regulator